MSRVHVQWSRELWAAYEDGQLMVPDRWSGIDLAGWGGPPYYAHVVIDDPEAPDEYEGRWVDMNTYTDGRVEYHNVRDQP
jgi:hypothetical protein